MTGQPSQEATAAYEVLRSQALGHSSGTGPGLGLAVVLRQGLPGWLRVWTERVADQRPAAPAAHLPVPLAPELALVLTAMVLHTSQAQPA